jgi:hypothetical protein
MNEPVTDLRKLERDAFRRFYEDGIFDIYMGVMLLVFFASSVLWEALESELVSYAAILGLALLVTVPLLVYRRRLLRERLGTFQPGPQRKLRISRTRWVLLGSVALGLIVFVAMAVAVAEPSRLDLASLFVPLLWLVNAVVVFGAMAYYLDVPRFYVYGVVGGLLMPLVIWPDALWGIEVPPWLVFGSAGVALVVFGLLKLRRFLRDYPAPGHG